MDDEVRCPFTGQLPYQLPMASFDSLISFLPFGFALSVCKLS